MKIAFTGYEIQEKYNNNTARDEDGDIVRYLTEKGIVLDRVVWDDPQVDWSQYKAVILKSPWDYHEKHAAFLQWIENLPVPVWNSAATVKWNSDKHYLKEVADAGLSVIKTKYISSSEELSKQLFVALDSERLVVKPCISAGAKNTVILTPENLEALTPQVGSWLEEEAYMVQPYVEQIQEGEWSLLFFGGRYSHSLLKTPKEADFRVQHYLGGKVNYLQASERLIREAEEYVRTFAADTLYARVDGVLIDGTFHLMELELIEPYLFINGETERMENYYLALKERLN
jgi:glutathione synthase/RimK-type ligase-like ATP-grasp enzyme